MPTDLHSGHLSGVHACDNCDGIDPASCMFNPTPRAVFTTGPLTLEVFDGWAALSQNGAQIDLDDSALYWLDDVLSKWKEWAGS